MIKNYSIICNNCGSENFTDDLDKNERVFLNCFNCENEIGEIIPRFYLFLEFILFLLNLSILVSIIVISGYFFDNYPDWKFSSGFVFCFTMMMSSIALHEFFHAFLDIFRRLWWRATRGWPDYSSTRNLWCGRDLVPRRPRPISSLRLLPLLATHAEATAAVTTQK